MDMVTIERLGGLAGFGGPNLKSEGQMALSDLSSADQVAVAELFEPGRKAPRAVPDGFRYRLTRIIGGQSRSVEAAEECVPAPLIDSIRDSLK
jgi:hypothetical protein